MKFVFGTSDEKAVEYVNQEGGSIGTPVMGALVEYEFDTDGTFQLVIENQWFNVEDLEYFIDFLVAAKDELQKREKNDA